MAHRRERARAGTAARCRAGLRVLGLSALSLPGCSGEAFHLVDSSVLGASDDAGTFPPLVTDSTHHDAEPASDGAGAAGGSSSSAPPDAGPAVTPPAPASPCGVARRADASLADDEVCVRAGTFSMGSSTAPGSGYFAHGPVHAVTLSAYFLDAFEVTVARYRRCVEAGACVAPSSTAAQGCTYTLAPADQEQHPVTCVPWPSAHDFCEWDGARHLPTEAQWEQAARNSAGSRYPWGETFTCDRAVLAGASQCMQYSGLLPQPVGSARAGASTERAFDLTGNAAEWVGDWFGGYPATAVTNPEGPGSGQTRIQRGGSWLTPAGDATSYARRGDAPAAIGPFSFRCARGADP
jgi:formylglycine-generating enzyme required for sulfatase activity